MRLELLSPLKPDGEHEIKQDIGAIVTRAIPGKLVMEIGPADGPPHLRLTLTSSEAVQLGTILQKIASGGGEEILLADP